MKRLENNIFYNNYSIFSINIKNVKEIVPFRFAFITYNRNFYYFNIVT
jgi:hypothetical protein